MSQAAYSNLKAAWHTDEIEQLRCGLKIVPKQVQLIISDLCNHDCHFCSYRMTGGFSTEQFADEKGNKNPNRKMTTEKALEILNDCSDLGVQAIQFTGGGEPTVHPDHLTIMATAQSMDMQTSLVTNGFLLRPGWQDVFARLSWLRVSIDAGRDEDYAKVRNISPGGYSRTLTNVRKMADCLEERKSDCLLGCGYVVTRENWEGMISGIEHIKATGAKYVRLAAMFSRDGSHYYKGIYDEILSRIMWARKAYEDETFKVVDLFGDRISDLDQHSPDYATCGYQQFNTYVGANLKVYRCCTTSYTLHGEVGDLTGQRFAEWLKDTETHRLYSEFNARTCDICQFNDKNRVIDYLLDPEPTHVDFV